MLMLGWFFLFLAVPFSMARDITLQSFDVDPSNDPTFVDMGTVRITKKSRNLLVVSGSWELFRNLGSDVLYSWNLLIKSPLSGEYRLLMRQQQSFCEYINTDTVMMPGIRNASNLPEAGTCPLPKGKYHIDNFEAKVSEALPLVKGDYLLRASCISEGRQLAGFEWKFSVD